MNQMFGEMLLSENVITEDQLQSALAIQRLGGGDLGAILVCFEFVSEERLTEFLGEQLRVPVLRLSDLVVESQVSMLVDVEVLERHQFLPLCRHGGTLLIVAAEPLEPRDIDNLSVLTGLRIMIAVATPSDIKQAMDYYFHGKGCPELEHAEEVRLRVSAAASPEAAGVLS